MFINNEDEDDDCVIVKRFVVLSLSQILSKSQEGESSKHTNIFVSLNPDSREPDKISYLTFGVCSMLDVIKLVIRN